MDLSPTSVSGRGTHGPGHPHGGGQGAGPRGAICLPSCPGGASVAARHLPLGTEPWEADLTQSHAIRLSEEHRPHSYDRFYPQDDPSDTKGCGFSTPITHCAALQTRDMDWVPCGFLQRRQCRPGSAQSRQGAAQPHVSTSAPGARVRFLVPVPLPDRTLETGGSRDPHCGFATLLEGLTESRETRLASTGFLSGAQLRDGHVEDPRSPAGAPLSPGP